MYDLVDYDDALRHTILTSDKVLAPWEPDGERFGPGVVIEGQERRTSEGKYVIGLKKVEVKFKIVLY